MATNDLQIDSSGTASYEYGRAWSASIISQLQPFNEIRFDSAIALLSRRHKRPLSKYEAVKLHVLMDIYHTLETGNPIIGGNLEPWAGGPVVPEAYSRIDNWCDRYDYTGDMPERFKIESTGKLRYLTPVFDADSEDFSGSELSAMDIAWNILIPMMSKGYQGYVESQIFFHSDDTFIGRAYNKAKAESRAIDWNDILDAFDAINGTDHSHIKALIRF